MTGPHHSVIGGLAAGRGTEPVRTLAAAGRVIAEDVEIRRVEVFG